jgi:glucan biosynthesis protein C
MSSSHLPAASPSSERLHGLDALRGTALLLGLVLHAAMAYIPQPIWIATDATAAPGAGVVFFAIHLFRMTTFFLIAGLFAHMATQRKGWVRFATDRLVRIGGVLATFWGLVLAGIIAVLLWKVAIDNGGSLPKDGPPPPPFTMETFPLTHLWFLWVLLIFYAVLLIVRAVVGLDRTGIVVRVADRLTGALIGPWTPVVLALPLAVAFWLKPAWSAFFGIPTPDTGLVPNAVALTAFGVAFGFGVMLDRRRDLLGRIANLWPVFTVVGLGAGAGAYVLTGGPVIRLEPVTVPALKAATACLYAFAVYATTLAAVALSLRFASGHSTVRRYLADASYWVYIVHLPLVMAGQVLLLDAPWPWFVKLAAVVAGVLAISLITYELVVRHTFMGRWLNGRRVPWRKPTPALVPAE